MLMIIVRLPLILTKPDFDGDGIGDLCDDDIDGDGVPNASDLCAETPADSVVDVDGCVIFTLPANNFSVRSTGESCIASNNGTVSVSALDATLNYTATLTDADAMATAAVFSDETTFNDLSAGNYNLCLTVEGQTGYELCFDITITEPEPLSVASKVSSLKSEVVLSLKGGKEYLIELNGEAFITTEDEITLQLKNIENVLSVRTDKDCQGTYEETIVLSDKILVYPNPVTSQNLNVFLGSDEFNEIQASIFSTDGRKVMGDFYKPNGGYINMNISGLPQGIYILNIKTDNSLLNYKNLKKMKLNTIRYISILTAAIFMVGCSSSSGDDTPTPPPIGGGDDEPVIPAPSAATLIFPEDNTECNTGIVDVDE